MKQNCVGLIGHVLLLASYFFSTAIIAQKNTWTWIGGDAYHANSPVYEKLNGGPEVNPGAREGAVTVVSNGRVYLFGGATAKVGMDPKYLEWSPSTCYRNDLWEYDPSMKAWRFVSGTKATVSWQDPQPRVGAALWVLGTKAYIFGGQVWEGQDYYYEKNDMWEYDLATGAQNMLFKNYSSGLPSPRSFSQTWIYNNKLYLFGGGGKTDRVGGTFSYFLNDIWEYNPTSNTWLQLRPNSVGENAVYGDFRIYSANNIPGGRIKAGTTQIGDKVFLFGGLGKTDTGSSVGELNDLWEYNLGINQWRWISGSKTLNGNATYGTINQPSVANIPGARNSAGCWWLDGKIWIGSGYGVDAQNQKGNLNDLWSYDTATLQWCWRKGSNIKEVAGYFGSINSGSEQTNPGAKSLFDYWTINNSLMLWGGFGIDNNGNTGRMNDLWSFDADASTWTWVGGNAVSDNNFYKSGKYGSKEVGNATNYPGGREKAITWTALGKFYLFGGWGVDSRGKTGWLNDLWEYDPPSKKWAWISGFDTCNGSATYGTRGIPATENLPGPRGLAASWSHRGSLYLFGGKGLDKNGSEGMLNDLWAYDLLAKKWKWLKGADTINAPGSYGTLGNAAESNEPPPRGNAARWILNNKFYFFGGAVWNVDGFLGKTFNDTWEYNIASNQWRWLKGESAPSSGNPANDSTPGAKGSSHSWTVENILLLAGAKSSETWSFDPTLNRWHLLDKGSGWCWQMSPHIWFDYGTDWTVANGTYLFGGEGTSWWRADCCELYTWKGLTQQLSGGGSTSDFLNATPLGGGTMDAKSNIANTGINTAGGWPGSRRDAVGWSLPGQLYLFGGYGMDASRMYGTLDDLWVYNLTDSVKPSDTAGSRSINDIHAEPHIATNPYNIVATIMPSGAQPVAGSVNIRLWIDATEQRANGKAYSRRHFEFQPAENAANATATVTLYFTQAEFDSFNTAGVSRKLPANPNDALGKSNLRISKTAGFSADGTGDFGSYSGTEKVIDPDDTQIIWNNTHGRWEVSFETVGFSGFFLHTYETGLPVNYTYLQGTATQQGIALQWACEASEALTQHLERSTDGSRFEPLTELSYAPAALRNFTYLDLAETLPLSNRLWYRIRQQLANGGLHYSNTIMLRVPEATQPVWLLNNPIQDFATLQLHSKAKTTASIRVMDVAGRVLSNKQQQLQAGLNTLRLETNHLVNGVYYLQIRLGDRNHFTSFLKQ